MTSKTGTVSYDRGGQWTWTVSKQGGLISTVYGGAVISFAYEEPLFGCDIEMTVDGDGEDGDKMRWNTRSEMTKAVVGMAAGYGLPELDRLCVAIERLWTARGEL